jgi:uncharacterized membrane protein
MIPTTTTVPSQERIAAALASIVFFIPLLMNVKTPFVVKYMKQGFLINVISLAIGIIGSFLWFLYGIIGILNIVCIGTSLFLAFQAYSGKEHVINVIYDNSEKLINALGITNLFTPGK